MSIINSNPCNSSVLLHGPSVGGITLPITRKEEIWIFLGRRDVPNLMRMTEYRRADLEHILIKGQQMNLFKDEHALCYSLHLLTDCWSWLFSLSSRLAIHASIHSLPRLVLGVPASQ